MFSDLSVSYLWEERGAWKMQTSKMQTADLENTDLENADLENADLENTDLENADLETADLENDLEKVVCLLIEKLCSFIKWIGERKFKTAQNYHWGSSSVLINWAYPKVLIRTR